MSTTLYHSTTPTPYSFGWSIGIQHLTMSTSVQTGAGTVSTATSPSSTTAMAVTNTGESFWSALIDQAITVSGPISVNVWAMESNAMANATLTAQIGVSRADGQTSTTLGTGTSAELTTTKSLISFTVVPTTTTLQEGDQIYVYISYSGTQNSGYTLTTWWGGSSASQADTRVTFTENLIFKNFVEPAGDKLYLSSRSAFDYYTSGYAEQNLYTSTYPKALAPYILPPGFESYGIADIQLNSNRPVGGNQLQTTHVDIEGLGKFMPFMTRRLKAQTIGGILKFRVAITGHTSNPVNTVFNCYARVYKHVASPTQNLSVGGTETEICRGWVANCPNSSYYTWNTNYVWMPYTTFNEGEYLSIRFWQDSVGVGQGYFAYGGTTDTYVTFSQTLEYMPWKDAISQPDSVPNSINRSHSPSIIQSHSW